MRHGKKRLKLNRRKSVRQGLFRNMAASLILYEKVKTTETRAKRLQPIIEKLIIIAKKEDKKNAIRELNAMLFDTNACRKLIEKIGDRYKDRKSGFTRRSNIGYRSGDSAKLVQIELI